MAETLTPQQKMAVTDRGGKLLVSAAAGSGKTKVLVDRLLSYLTQPEDPANIDDFLMITYTKAAAAELRGKIAQKLTERLAADPGNRHLQQQMQRLYLAKISTVHAFCGDILREYAYSLDLSGDFRVAEENECRLLQQQVLEGLLDKAYEEGTEAFRAFVDTQGFGRSDRSVPEIVLKVYNSARCHLNPSAWLEQCRREIPVGEDAAKTPWGEYLMGEFLRSVGLHRAALERCIQLATGLDGSEKPLALLESTVRQLRQLEGCRSWDELYHHPGVDFGRLNFPKAFPDETLKETIKAVRDACKLALGKKDKIFSDSSAQVLEDLEKTRLSVEGLVGLVEEFSQAYDRLKRSRRVMDFGDLEHKMLDLLLGKHRSGPTALAREIGERFREIMVDEYQDSNQVQDAIFSALTAQKQNCFMVGDVKQSIYQFRLADPGIFLEKYNRFVPAEEAQPGQGRKVLLTRNFRSAGQVIAGVNAVFGCCMSPEVGGLIYGEGERLYEGIRHIPQSEPEVELYGIQVQADTYREEAAFTARRIRELLTEEHFVREKDTLRRIRPEDIVILLRSPGSVGGEFQYALEQLGIPCVTGNGEDLLQSREVSTLRALLQTIDNPLQDIPLVAVLASPLFGFTADDLAQIRKADRNAPFIRVMEKSERQDCRAFLELLGKLRAQARMNDVSKLLQDIFALTRMDSLYGAMEEGQPENLQAFCRLAEDYERNGHKDLGQFLDYLQALEEKGVTAPAQEGSSGAVTIMSIHKSKGLEFPVVFLCGLSRSFNQESARDQVLCHKELGLGLSWVNTDQRVRYPTIAKRAISAKIEDSTISEEMRVLYVAMTRAKDRLIMTYAQKNLEKELTNLVRRMDVTDPLLLTWDVDCPGTWVLYTALHRTEAGALFALGGKPNCSQVQEIPWKIQVVEGENLSAQTETQSAKIQEIEPEILGKMEKFLRFSYPYTAATQTPSKQTATQLKGRPKDQEVAEAAQVRQPERVWRKPSFAGGSPQGKDYGNAVHTLMEHIRFQKDMSLDYVNSEIARMEEEGFLTREECMGIRPKKIHAFFATEEGKALCASPKVLREFKFSILVDAQSREPSMIGEKILLQGVVDCAMVEDSITVVDFKTDHVTKDSLEAAVRRYAPQIMAYGKAMEKIFQKPVKKKLLYFFHLGAFAEVTE